VIIFFGVEWGTTDGVKFVGEVAVVTLQDSMQLDLGSVRITPHADYFLFLLQH